VRLSGREWIHVARSALAFEDWRRRTEGGNYVGTKPRADVPEVLETRLRYWAEGACFREERDSLTIVCDGERTWTWTPEAGAVVANRGASSELDLLHPLALVLAFELEPFGTADVAGRAALAVRARPRDDASRMHSLGLGADELELVVDAERGILLRTEARHGSEAFRVLEVEEIAFDEGLPPNTFVFEPPPGETVRPIEEAYRWDDVSVEEAAKRASFTVWVPRGLHERWRVHAIHRPASERPNLDETVHLLYFDDALHNFSIEQAGVRLLAWRTDPPRVIERDGAELRLIEGKPLEVHLERGGTQLRISSDTLDADALVELATSLVEAPTEPPPLF
jgi:hypothetical protein